MGQVYLARDLKLHRVVAVKALSRTFAILPEASSSFLREAQLGARLEHAGIVSIYAFGEHDGIPFLVMQFLGGGTLADRIRSELLPDEVVAPLLADLADALGFAHRQGVVHRDVKPENVLFSDPESTARPMIADFGVATRPTHDAGPGQRRLGYGTPHFMSPEQSQGDLNLDGRSDLFSLGVLGYLLLTGTYPYDGPSEPSIAAARIRGARTPLHLAAPHAPPRLVAAVERCLAPDPANRWQSAEEFARAVRSSVVVSSPGGPSRRTGSRRSGPMMQPPSTHRRTLTDLISSVPAAVRRSVRSLGGIPLMARRASRIDPLQSLRIE